MFSDNIGNLIIIYFSEENMMWRARSFGDSQMFLRAKDLKTSSCDALQNLYNNPNHHH